MVFFLVWAFLLEGGSLKVAINLEIEFKNKYKHNKIMEILEKHQNLVKVFLVVFIVSCLISIFKAGYSFGQFLFASGF